MSRGSRLRGMILGVAATVVVLLALSRWVGRIGPSERGGRGADRTAAHAGAASGAPDLTFYRALGTTPAAGKRPAAPPADPSLRPAPGDLVTPGGAYVVQVLATRDEGQAKRLRDRLASRGYPATLSQDDTGGTPVWRVRLGRWRERGPAEAMAEKVRTKEGAEPWVLQEPGP